MKEQDLMGIKMIRFINSHYDDLFRIEDGKYIQVNFRDHAVLKRCFYVDEYHAKIDGVVYHICQFAEMMEKANVTYNPEVENDEWKKAWKVGKNNFLVLQTCDDGYDYTMYDNHYKEIDGGQLDMPELSMLEARDIILKDFDLKHHDLVVEDYDDILEKVEEVEHQVQMILSFNRETDNLAFDLTDFFEDVDLYEYRDVVENKEETVAKLKQQILSGETKEIKDYLKSMVGEDSDDQYIAEDLLNELEDFESRSNIIKPSVLALLKEKKDEVSIKGINTKEFVEER